MSPRAAQAFKWVVYTLLVVNSVYYFVEEIYIASHTMTDQDDLLKWAGAFATTFDQVGWLSLLFLFELETYQISDETLERRGVRWTIHGFRAVCYVLLAHTVFERGTAIVEFKAAKPAPQIESLCELAGDEVSFGRNYRYTRIDQSNCGSLSSGSSFYFLEPSVITDEAGYALEKKHVWVDLNDACVWLIVVLLIELSVRLQNRDRSGAAVTGLILVTRFLYGVLFAHALFWLWVGHWVYAWDQVLWIVGFWIIDHNLAMWRAEIEERGR